MPKSLRSARKDSLDRQPGGAPFRIAILEPANPEAARAQMRHRLVGQDAVPWWDRLFGTYRAQPQAGHEGMTIGIEQFRDPRELRLDRMLLQPFRDDHRSYPLSRREPAV